MPRHQATSRQILLHYCTSNQSFVPAAIVGRTLKSSSLQIPQPPRLRVARRPTTLVQPRGLGHSSALPPGATHTTEHKKLGYFYRRISTQNPTSVSVSPGFRGGATSTLIPFSDVPCVQHRGALSLPPVGGRPGPDDQLRSATKQHPCDFQRGSS